jgi:hypothetical protein
MNDLDFYKSIYDRELNRRVRLDDSVSIPIGLISLIIGLISYFYTNKEFNQIIIKNFSVIILITITLICLAISITYLIKSYNNFLRGFDYPNISYLKEVREFQKVKIPEYNSKVEIEKQLVFEEKLIEKLISITDENTKINDKRSFDIYLAKTFLILSLIFMFVTTILLIIKNTKLC